MLMPNNGKLVITNGKKAQCIAHATDVTIPQASQLIFILMTNISKNATLLQMKMLLSK
jgi:hypothetical protein